MKLKIEIRLFLISISGMFLATCMTQPKGTYPKFSSRQVKDKTLIPEGIAVHTITGRVYLSSLHQNKIVSVDGNGAVTDITTSGQEGFMWGLGIKFSKNGKVLWSCSADGKGHTALFAIDHLNGKILKRYIHDSARFFNDLVILNDERIFITDTEIGALFLLNKDTLQLFLIDEQLMWANGITATPKGDILFVASGRYGLMKINTVTRVITSATNNKRTDYAIDGLVLHGNTLYAAIGWPQDSVHQHRIIRYYLDEQFNYMDGDTLSINQTWLQCPTTLALHKNQLFSLSSTNLGIYNRHNQQTSKIKDSLSFPVVAVFQLQQQ